MSVYDSGVSAYRDTTKWLVAFVPIGSLVAAAVTLGPDLVLSIETTSAVDDWFASYWLVAICGLALIAGISAIVYYGALVLSVAPSDLGEMTKQSYADTLAKAIGEGVTAPEFFSVGDFQSAMAALADAWDQPKVASDDPRLTRLKGAIDNLREWSIFSKVRDKFGDFAIAFVLGTAAIAIAIILAPAQLNQGLAIDKPTPVAVQLDADAVKDLSDKTKCTNATGATFIAIGGTWERPKLVVDGDDCEFGATWLPNPNDVELRPLPAADSP